jgi:hypothetical protein
MAHKSRKKTESLFRTPARKYRLLDADGRVVGRSNLRTAADARSAIRERTRNAPEHAPYRAQVRELPSGHWHAMP